ncbi:hypothetical protein F2Q69_00052171 [Brassica cretica]|uniref:Uncharacterized protein n=1 Tax=Brassica cretica TaxID=69181 RepID=A0A8S9N6G6_BRACR|nr:hypothetical protein F2Q69_00052171 [Brassica cretica]
MVAVSFISSVVAESFNHRRKSKLKSTIHAVVVNNPRQCSESPPWKLRNRHRESSLQSCLNGIQSTKMKEVRDGMTKDVLFDLN